MFGLFAPRRRKASLWYGVSLSRLEGLEDRLLLSAVGSLDLPEIDHEHDPNHGDHEDHYPYIEEFSDVPEEAWLTESGIDDADTFFLHSKPDSNFTIYLDFNGFTTNGVWNTNPNDPVLTHLGYDTDGDLTSFSSQELNNIQRIWQMVAEDFAPFDVNVTTEEPPVEDLINSGGGDTRWGSRAVMTINNNGACSGCGGVAFVGSFDGPWDDPAYVFNGTRSNGGIFALAETISHEVGHNVGLLHDGLSTAEYYGGHGTGAEGWGPIMGAPFGKTTTQWSIGDYFDASRQQDDLSVITTQNGFGYRPDDYGSSRGAATVLTPVNGTQIDFTGIIEQNTDIDYFRFESGTGTVTFDISTFSDRPNLNVFAAIYDASGTLITQVNPKNQAGATISASVTTGNYYLRIEGVGSDDVYNPANDQVEAPANPPYQQNPPLGFSDYGSLGFYTVSGDVPAARADYGDAPDSYGTTSASDGPAHLDVGPILGSVRDTETDGIPGVNANSDDSFGTDDEDGVVFLNTLIPGRRATLTVTSATGGVLDGWIDFDGSGTFDISEQVFIDTDVLQGSNTLTVDVPLNAVAGTTYARFRIAELQDDVTSPTGKATNGEVEDYKLEVRPAQVINEVLFDVNGDDTGKEYIELRSEPGTVIAPGTYLVMVDGDANGGVVKMIYDLSGLQYGTNGYLILLQNGNPYEAAGLVDSEATKVVSLGNGWRSGRVSILGFSENNLEDGSQTYFLMKAPAKPLLGGDIDANNDGVGDGTMFNSWDIIDAVGYVDGDTADFAYGEINFRTNGGGTVTPGSTSVNSGAVPLGYLGRNGESQGNSAAVWTGATLLPDDGPIFTLDGSTLSALAGRPLDHLGSLNFDQADYGDLPDSYLTLQESGGAEHGPGGPIFGVLKDLESNGKPSLDAQQDDLVSSDDEDGVTIPALREGTAGTVSFQVTGASGGATIRGWFDWNGDGDFDDAGEDVIDQAVSVDGLVTIQVTAPIGAFDDTDGSTYARFRISTTRVDGPAGVAADGEVEDYQLTVLTSATSDFGDAPDSYGTSLANNGARHIGTGPVLGSLRDIERDALVSVDALGDDGFKDDDEDGVFILTAIAPGHTSQAEITSDTGGVLDAWLDLDGNGTFDAGEQVITDVVLTAGVNIVDFAVPATAAVGTTFARFRIAATAADVTGPTGAAANGEVEDYQVEILSIFNRPPVLPAAFFSLDENSPNGTPVGTVFATDPDPGQTITYSIIGGNFGGAFQIDPLTGEITVAATEWVDYEIRPTFELQVKATDSGNPKLFGTATVTVSLNNLIDAPSFLVREQERVDFRVGKVPSSLSVPPLGYSIVNGNDGNTFRIDSEGILIVNDNTLLDFESHPVFELEVTVIDGNSSVEQVFVTVKVLDRNEAPVPTFDTFNFSVMDQVSVGHQVGQVTATDPDRFQTLQFGIFSGNVDGVFAIDSETGVITVADRSKLDFDHRHAYDLVVTVSDSADVPFTISINVHIDVREYVYFNTFENGPLGSEWTSQGNNVAVLGTPDGGTQQLILTDTQGSGVSATLEVDLSQYTDLALQFQATLAVGLEDPVIDGLVEVSNNGGHTWVAVRTFSSLVDATGVKQRYVVQLTEVTRSFGHELTGPTLIRFSAHSAGPSLGAIRIDNLYLSGAFRQRTPDDVILLNRQTEAGRTFNSFQIGLSDGSSITSSKASWYSGDWQFAYGDFNGDRRMDVVGLGADGKWVVGLSNGSGLQLQNWGQWKQDAGWQILAVGDFNGDGLDDVAAQKANGAIWIAKSNAVRFVEQYGTNYGLTPDAQFRSGDVNGDGRDDLIGLLGNGDLIVGMGSSTRFESRFGGNLGYHSWLDFNVGDFDGDGRTDIIARKNVVGTSDPVLVNSNGQLWIGAWTATGFDFRFATRWDASKTWSNVVVGDFNGDGLDDIAGRQNTGAWWGSLSNGTRLENRYFGRTSAAASLSTVGDFNGDGIVDIATFYQNTRTWQVGIMGGERPLFTDFGRVTRGTYSLAGSGQID
ncbi:MAG: cadherin domain-containing protein [Planctomycetaceae bacterium]|nr:cadherin domain-containing protein [Planctomycetaceae bacterium]